MVDSVQSMKWLMRVKVGRLGIVDDIVDGS